MTPKPSRRPPSTDCPCTGSGAAGQVAPSVLPVDPSQTQPARRRRRRRRSTPPLTQVDQAGRPVLHRRRPRTPRSPPTSPSSRGPCSRSRRRARTSSPTTLSSSNSARMTSPDFNPVYAAVTPAGGSTGERAGRRTSPPSRPGSNKSSRPSSPAAQAQKLVFIPGQFATDASGTGTGDPAQHHQRPVHRELVQQHRLRSPLHHHGGRHGDRQHRDLPGHDTVDRRHPRRAHVPARRRPQPPGLDPRRAGQHRTRRVDRHRPSGRRVSPTSASSSSRSATPPATAATAPTRRATTRPARATAGYSFAISPARGRQRPVPRPDHRAGHRPRRRQLHRHRQRRHAQDLHHDVHGDRHRRRPERGQDHRARRHHHGRRHPHRHPPARRDGHLAGPERAATRPTPSCRPRSPARSALTDHRMRRSRDARHLDERQPHGALRRHRPVRAHDRPSTFRTTSTAPRRRSRSAPPRRRLTNAGTAVFNFSATDPDEPAFPVTFTCQLDSAPAVACTSPYTATVPAPIDGAHVFTRRRVRPGRQHDLASLELAHRHHRSGVPGLHRPGRPDQPDVGDVRLHRGRPARHRRAPVRVHT